MSLLVHYLWHSREPAARLCRGLLLGPSVLYRALVAARLRVYQSGLLPVGRPECPVISVGNLTVGGTGKTPLCTWIASYCASKGLTPAVVLRGYGGDEAQIHRVLVPRARVIQSKDRMAGVRRALSEGAEVAILDDGFQRLDVARDWDVVVVSAESWQAASWTLPAGPWREPVQELVRADFMVVTRRCMPVERAAMLLEEGADILGEERVAQVHLAMSWLEPLGGGRSVDPGALAGSRVLAVCGIGDPVSFRVQLASFGAEVKLLAWPDHHAYRWKDARKICTMARQFDYLVITLKDRWKLAGYLDGLQGRVLVAHQEIRWESGFDHFRRSLEGTLARVAKSEARVGNLCNKVSNETRCRR